MEHLLSISVTSPFKNLKQIKNDSGPFQMKLQLIMDKLTRKEMKREVTN